MSASTLRQLAEERDWDALADRATDPALPAAEAETLALALLARGELAGLHRALGRRRPDRAPLSPVVQLLDADAAAREQQLDYGQLASLSRLDLSDDAALRLWLRAITAEHELWRGRPSGLLHAHVDADDREITGSLAAMARGRLLRIQAVAAAVLGGPGDSEARARQREACHQLDAAGCDEDSAMTDGVVAFAEIVFGGVREPGGWRAVDDAARRLAGLGSDRTSGLVIAAGAAAFLVGEVAGVPGVLERLDELRSPLPPALAPVASLLSTLATLALDGPTRATLRQIEDALDEMHRHLLPAWVSMEIASALLDLGEIDLARHLFALAPHDTADLGDQAPLLGAEVAARLGLLADHDAAALARLEAVVVRWEAGGRARAAAMASLRAALDAERIGRAVDAARLRSWGADRLPDEGERTLWERRLLERERTETSAATLRPRGRITMLSPDVSVERDGSIVPLGDMPARLLTLLVTADGPVTTDWLIDALWGGVDLDTGRNRLNVVVHRLRERLGIEQDELVVRDRHGFHLDPTGWDIDVQRFLALASGDERDRRRAHELYQCDLASSQFAYDEAVGERRESLRARYLALTRS